MKNHLNQNLIERKLNQIGDIWNKYIWDYPLCNSHIRFNDEAKTNYFGDILHYFYDTFEIIYSDQITYKDYSKGQFKNSLMYKISLLQSIYVQQDLVEELLLLFKCNIVKGNLKKNTNYSINRDIRNELVGHPLRRLKGELISSSIFSHKSQKGTISYLRYHKNNNYEFEYLNYELSEIIKRHSLFLNMYFDLIIDKLLIITNRFKKNLKSYLNIIPKLNFEQIIDLTKLNYPTIFNSYAYKVDNLRDTYKNINKHPRYKTVINNFICELKEAITETIASINHMNINDKPDNPSIVSLKSEERIIENKDNNTIIIKIEKAVPKKLNFSYELSKLVQNKAFHLFKWNKKSLLSKISDNEVIIEELNHMEKNFNNDFEYHCSFNYMSRVLDKIQKST